MKCIINYQYFAPGEPSRQSTLIEWDSFFIKKYFHSNWRKAYNLFYGFAVVFFNIRSLYTYCPIPKFPYKLLSICTYVSICLYIIIFLSTFVLMILGTYCSISTPLQYDSYASIYIFMSLYISISLWCIYVSRNIFIFYLCPDNVSVSVYV